MVEIPRRINVFLIHGSQPMSHVVHHATDANQESAKEQVILRHDDDQPAMLAAVLWWMYSMQCPGDPPQECMINQKIETISFQNTYPAYTTVLHDRMVFYVKLYCTADRFIMPKLELVALNRLQGELLRCSYVECESEPAFIRMMAFTDSLDARLRDRVYESIAWIIEELMRSKHHDDIQIGMSDTLFGHPWLGRACHDADCARRDVWTCTGCSASRHAADFSQRYMGNLVSDPICVPVKFGDGIKILMCRCRFRGLCSDRCLLDEEIWMQERVCSGLACRKCMVLLVQRSMTDKTPMKCHLAMGSKGLINGIPSLED